VMNFFPIRVRAIGLRSDASWPCRNLLAKSDAKESALFQWVVTGH
jgi:hypothetical protein